MLIRYAFSRFRDLREDFVFQHDDALPYHSNELKAYLDGNLPDRWIARGGPILWPPHSYDLSLNDFSLWGYIKLKIHDTPIDSIEELRRRIRVELNRIIKRTLLKLWENTKSRLNDIMKHNGVHKKIFWTGKNSTHHWLFEVEKGSKNY